MANPGTLHFPPCKRGNNFSRYKVQVNRSLENLSIELNIRSSVGRILYKQLTLENDGIRVIDAENGWFQINQFEVTMPAGIYLYDLNFKYGAQAPITAVTGTITILENY